MGLPPIGSVIVLPFPFADYSGYKVRPAIVVAHAEFSNLIVCQVTSKPYTSKQAVSVINKDFKSGQLPVDSYARPDKISTIDPKLVRNQIGILKPVKISEIRRQIKKLF